MAEAMEWLAVLTTIALEMVLPGIAGQWLDRRLGTQYLALIGLVLGVSFGLWHLIRVTRIDPDPPKSRPQPLQPSNLEHHTPDLKTTDLKTTDLKTTDLKTSEQPKPPPSESKPPT